MYVSAGQLLAKLRSISRSLQGKKKCAGENNYIQAGLLLLLKVLILKDSKHKMKIPASLSAFAISGVYQIQVRPLIIRWKWIERRERQIEKHREDTPTVGSNMLNWDVKNGKMKRAQRL